MSRGTTVGSTQPEVTAVLGDPKASSVVSNQTVSVYEFRDGLPKGSKARIVLYICRRCLYGVPGGSDILAGRVGAASGKRRDSSRNL